MYKQKIFLGMLASIAEQKESLSRHSLMTSFFGMKMSKDMSRTNLLTVLIILAMNGAHSAERIGQVHNYV